MTTNSEPLAQGNPAFQNKSANFLAEAPWWAFLIILAGIVLLYNFMTNETYYKIISTLVEGVQVTALAAISAYSIALVFGLTTALMQLSSNVVARNIGQLYVQIIRGVPILVQILYWGFVVGPAIVGGINNLGVWLGDIGLLAPENALAVYKMEFMVRGVFALAFSYGAFSSEIFRAGLQSIERGQREAASALGLSWFQSFRFVILPQALRRILPPLGNDFIAMVKETSLLSALGIGDITQLGKKYGAASFLYLQTYNTVAFLYLSLTLLLSSGVRFMERRLKSDQRK
ncbi:MAG: amino acid ABC transporter permease [Anaerolineales bacterium]|nr:amino acid ABC transporter permease [Anaerolineales bacterium]